MTIFVKIISKMILEDINYDIIYDIITQNSNFVDYIDEVYIDDEDIIIYYKGDYNTEEFSLTINEYKDKVILMRDKKINQILDESNL
jgi:hypothetical protein